MRVVLWISPVAYIEIDLYTVNDTGELITATLSVYIWARRRCCEGPILLHMQYTVYMSRYKRRRVGGSLRTLSRCSFWASGYQLGSCEHIENQCGSSQTCELRGHIRE